MEFTSVNLGGITGLRDVVVGERLGLVRMDQDEPLCSHVELLQVLGLGGASEVRSATPDLA